MAVGRTLTVLTLYDVLTDLIPGTLVVAVGLFLYPPLLESVRDVSVIWAIILFGGYVTGHFLRYLRNLGSPADDFQQRLREAEPHIDERVFSQIKEQFDLPEPDDEADTIFPNVSDWDVMRLILSHLETRPPTRALRMQSMYSFYRSMYAASWLVVGLSILAATVYAFWDSVVASAGTIVFLLILGIISVIVFRARREKFKNRFVRYAILDFYQDSVTGNE